MVSSWVLPCYMQDQCLGYKDFSAADNYIVMGQCKKGENIVLEMSDFYRNSTRVVEQLFWKEGVKVQLRFHVLYIPKMPHFHTSHAVPTSYVESPRVNICKISLEILNPPITPQQPSFTLHYHPMSPQDYD